MVEPRQLSLLKGRRQKGEAPPTPTEFKLHVALASLIRRTINKHWIFSHFPAGEKRDVVTASRLRAMGLQPGFPDFQFFGPQRSVFFLELKRPGSGRMSEAQIAVHAHLMACGFSYLCTNSIDEAVATLKELGIVRAQVSA